MTTRVSYADWQPLLLDENTTIATIGSGKYRRFIFEAAIVPGCRMLLARHRRRPEWPYVDTKFNPNTGADLPPAAYDVIHTWMLGRGSEALDEHLRVLDGCESLADDERAAIRALFESWIANMTRAMGDIADRYGDRIPFRVNRALVAVDAAGRLLPPGAFAPDAANVFCAKGMMSSRDSALQACGARLLRAAAVHARRNLPEMSTQTPGVGGVGHGMRMLIQGAAVCFARKARDAALREEALDMAAVMLGETLDRHYDPVTGIFSEYHDPVTRARGEYLDPGHAAELAGLGLSMIAHLEGSPLATRHAALVVRARRDLPALLLRAAAAGYNARHPGMYKGVNNRTGAPINRDMPWWNLPETMRAAVRACAAAETAAAQAQCLEIFRLCHNAYFSRYPNRANWLFPCQTIDGATGQVINVAPAVPEGDPLYHANCAFLDMLDALAGMQEPNEAR
jgi:mannose/cellobiose epimerase-like protein (N-acyl-D-glucosamine 2-epimerase family)